MSLAAGLEVPGSISPDKSWVMARWVAICLAGLVNRQRHGGRRRDRGRGSIRADYGQGVGSRGCVWRARRRG